MSTKPELAARLIEGDRRALSKAITLVESSHARDRENALELLDSIMPYTGEARRIAISGSPGVGKSTFIEAFGEHLIHTGKRIAVLTIDPSSSLTGGSILGDKTRMPMLANNSAAYIRPTPSGKLLGGVARRSRDVIALCEAAGYDTILIETVGVGQSEIEAANMSDCYLLLLQPGSGDSLQGIKRGIMEMADLLVVNKADGVLLASAQESAAQYMRSLSLIQERTPGWRCPVVLCSSTEKTGQDEISAQIDAYFTHAQASGAFAKKRHDQLLYWLEDETLAVLVDRFQRDSTIQARYTEATKQLESGRSPARIASEFVSLLLNNTTKS
jgi:LAO/AO transport system kinase